MPHASNAQMPFLDHLEELRIRLLKSGAALIVGCVLGFVVVRRFDVAALLIKPVQPYLAALGPSAEPGRLLAIYPGTPFILDLRLALIVGILLAAPVIGYQAWAFLAPALRRTERRIILPSLYLGLLLFSAGVYLAYSVALPLTLQFFYGFETDYLHYTLEANTYLSFVIRMLVAFGLIFELPVLAMILGGVGLVSPTFLRRKRRHALLALVVLASFLTPGDMILVTLLMIIPLFLLYELSIWLCRLTYPKDRGPRLSEMQSPLQSVEFAQ